MYNLPMGSENDQNAPWNKEELQGETVGIVDYIVNSCEISREASMLLQEFGKNNVEAKKIIDSLCNIWQNDLPELTNCLKIIKNLIVEPQIFIEDE